MTDVTEREQMEAAGFVWDLSINGRTRWTNIHLSVTALRADWMNDEHWHKHRAKKLAEAAKLRRFDELPVGTRFKLRREMYRAAGGAVYVKLSHMMIVEWKGSAPGIPRPNPEGIIDLARSGYITVVELFEPFDGMALGELQELPKNPLVWRALADWHSCQSTMAEAQEYLEPMRWHDKRMEECRAIADKLQQRFEDGEDL